MSGRKSDDERIVAAFQACDPEYRNARLERHSSLLRAVETATYELRVPRRAGICCGRWIHDVWLTIDDYLWDVDSLLERSHNDPQQAAHFALHDIDATAASAEPRN